MQTKIVFDNMQGVISLLKLIIANKVSHRLNAIHILNCSCNFVKTFGLGGID